MIEVTGKMPTVIKNKLSNAGILSDGLITGGNDIDLTFNAKGTETHLAATFVGNGKWVVDEIDDNANLFPQIEEGDSVSVDMITKLFIDSINSGLHNGYDMEYDYDHYDILSTLSKYADYEQDGLDSVGNTVYKIMWKKLYDENECKDYAEGMEEIYDINFSEDLSKMYISKDVPEDLFEESNVINSDLILSFNPLGKVKYGLMDVGKAVGRAAKKVGKGIADWAADRLDADQAEQFIRTHGPYRRKYLDTRDNKVKEKKDFNAGSINVGKIEKLPGMGHYKVLTGNPDTQDFQVWHLYRNGAKTRVLDLRTNLQAAEAQWAFDNNIPKSWSPSDWQNPDGKQQKANEIPLNQVGEEQEQTEEDNVEETTEQEQTEETTQEENNVEETQDTTEEVEQEDEDNVMEYSEGEETEESEQEDESDIHDFVVDHYNDNDDEDADYDIMNSVNREENNVIEGPDATESELDVEEDNVIDSGKKRKKSKYNGCNVTGYQDGMLGTMTAASWIKQNLGHFHNAMAAKNIKGKPEEQFNSVMNKLKDIISVNPKLALEMTKRSDDNLILDFSVVPGLNMKYVITLDFTENGVNITGSGVPEVGRTADEITAGKLEFVLKTLDDVIRTISGIGHTNRKP